MIHAWQDSEPWNVCVSTRGDAAFTECLAITTVDPATAASTLIDCECTYFEIEYDCAKTQCPDDGSLQSLYQDAHTSCTSIASAELVGSLAVTTGELTPHVDPTSSTEILSASDSLVPASTTMSSANSTSPAVGTTSAPEITASVGTGQPSSTTSASKSTANLALVPSRVIGWLMVFVAVMTASAW
ncbi:hypothetical protein F5Y12DRAFT_294336 [Xylaria sp. FL1777]|nr:hypothetical protein F5Y12DRAFT_294336 [Xylaria sp. FL1777]